MLEYYLRSIDHVHVSGKLFAEEYKNTMPCGEHIANPLTNFPILIVQAKISNLLILRVFLT